MKNRLIEGTKEDEKAARKGAINHILAYVSPGANRVFQEIEPQYEQSLRTTEGRKSRNTVYSMFAAGAIGLITLGAMNVNNISKSLDFMDAETQTKRDNYTAQIYTDKTSTNIIKIIVSSSNDELRVFQKGDFGFDSALREYQERSKRIK